MNKKLLVLLAICAFFTHACNAFKIQINNYCTQKPYTYNAYTSYKHRPYNDYKANNKPYKPYYKKSYSYSECKPLYTHTSVRDYYTPRYYTSYYEPEYYQSIRYEPIRHEHIIYREKPCYYRKSYPELEFFGGFLGGMLGGAIAAHR
jgi:hypothetical protein